jgi:DNA-binding NarL/FixJ family response regulator
MASDAPIRVFLLDDHEVVREGVRAMLDGADGIDVVGEAGTVAEAIARVPACRPDVAILDVQLPDGSGVEVCRTIRSDHPDVRALMLTSFADDEALFEAILAGASGYLLKQIRGNDIVEAVRRVAAGDSLLDPTLTTRVLDRMREPPQEDERLAKLTSQERAVLALIAEGLSNREIGERMFLAEKTIKNYVSAILSKLGMQRRTQAAVFAAETLKDKPPA